MSDTRASSFRLLGCFADFYEEVASIKLAIADGRLSGYLAVGDELPATRGNDLALRVSSKLAGILRQQAHEVAARGTATEVKAHRLAQYVMAAVADEVFVLDLDWAGNDAWLEVLLEYKMFRTRSAGQQFFHFADQLLSSGNRSALHVDLASVFLLALQLGFRGRYRGQHSVASLKKYRQDLYKFVNGDSEAGDEQPAFLQAYQHLLKADKEQRRAPLSRWLALGRTALYLYLGISTLVWITLTYPFQKAFGG